ncbi:MAG: tetratricopeptide repeat protein, partial [Bacteroidaceae bacterium]
LEPMFSLTYYEKDNLVKHTVNYYKFIDDLNRAKTFSKQLIITNMETALSEAQIKKHFASIDDYSSALVDNPENAKARFARALDFYLVQDFSNAIDDLTKAISSDETFFPAYFNRALIRCKQLEYQKVEEELSRQGGGVGIHNDEVKALDYDIVKKDLDQVIKLAPDFVYAYYNRGNVLSLLKDYRSAIVDYDKAIDLAPNFAEAYYNRGLTHIYLGNNRQGIADLSKAGELGIVAAYNVIKRFTEQID